MTMSEEWVDVVTLTDEDGNDVRFDHLLTFNHLEKTYIAMMAIDPVDGIDDDDVLLMEVVEDGDDDQYLPITSEVLLNEVFEVFLDLFDELIEEEEEEEQKADSILKDIQE